MPLFERVILKRTYIHFNSSIPLTKKLPTTQISLRSSLALDSQAPVQRPRGGGGASDFETLRSGGTSRVHYDTGRNNSPLHRRARHTWGDADEWVELMAYGAPVSPVERFLPRRINRADSLSCAVTAGLRHHMRGRDALSRERKRKTDGKGVGGGTSETTGVGQGVANGGGGSPRCDGTIGRWRQ